MADSKQLLAYPILEELGYREKIDPAKLNLMLRSLEESVLRALLRGTEIQDILNSLNTGITSSYLALSAQDQRLNNLANLSSGYLFATGFDTVRHEVAAGGAVAAAAGRVDNLMGVVTLDWDDSRKVSKIPRNSGIVSPNVEVYVDTVLRSQDDAIYNMFNRYNTDFWIESTATTSHTVEIHLPPAINKKFNYIELLPFPVFGMDITSIQYLDEQSLSHDIYPKQDNQFYNGSGPLIFHLSPRTYNGTILVNLDVRTGVGAMGFSKFDIGMIDYNNTDQVSYIKFNVPGGLTTITPTEASLDFYADGIEDYASVLPEISICSSVGGTNLLTLSATRSTQDDLGSVSIDVSNRQLYLKVKMREVNQTTPVVRGCRLKYEV